MTGKILSSWSVCCFLIADEVAVTQNFSKIYNIPNIVASIISKSNKIHLPAALALILILMCQGCSKKQDLKSEEANPVSFATDTSTNEQQVEETAVVAKQLAQPDSILNQLKGIGKDVAEVFTNAAEELSPTSSPSVKKISSSKHIDIPDITSIKNITEGKYANQGITSVTIPNTIEWIQDRAFENNNIKELRIPGSVQAIGIAAFKNNTIETLIIESSNSQLRILDEAFKDNNIKTLIIERTAIQLDKSSFENNAITSITINLRDGGQRSLTIGRYAFKNNKITDINLSRDFSKIEIWSGAFESNSLRNVTIQRNITRLDTCAFRDNKQLSSLTFEAKPAVIGYYIFQGCGFTNLPALTALTEIPMGMFMDNNITKLTIPNNIISVGTDAFLNNPLTDVDLPANFKKIGIGAFEPKDNTLKKIRIPSNIEFTGLTTKEIDEAKKEAKKRKLEDAAYIALAFSVLPIGAIAGLLNRGKIWDEAHEYSEGNEHFKNEFRKEYWGLGFPGAVFELKNNQWEAVRDY